MLMKCKLAIFCRPQWVNHGYIYLLTKHYTIWDDSYCDDLQNYIEILNIYVS